MGYPARVTVRRAPYTPRDSERGRLSGALNALLITDTNVFVSSGREFLRVREGADIRRIVEEAGTALERGDYAAFRRVGDAAAQAIEADYAEMVTYGSKVCVPGSTIKGLLRSRLELCPSRNGSSYFCMQSNVPPLMRTPNPGTHGWRHARIWERAVSEDRGPACNPLRTQDYSLCKVCDIFGSPGVAGRVMPGNFCCGREACVPLTLPPKAMKVIAVRPGTRLEGRIGFSALSLDELGVLLVSMGLRRGSVEGAKILLGRYKYALRNMGVAHFKVIRAEFPARFASTLNELGLEGKCAEGTANVVCEGNGLTELINAAIDEALEKYPQLTWLQNFSEASVREAKGLAR